MHFCVEVVQVRLEVGLIELLGQLSLEPAQVLSAQVFELVSAVRQLLVLLVCELLFLPVDLQLVERVDHLLRNDFLAFLHQLGLLSHHVLLLVGEDRLNGAVAALVGVLAIVFNESSEFGLGISPDLLVNLLACLRLVNFVLF